MTNWSAPSSTAIFPKPQKKPKVGGYSRLDLEAIVAIKPDLIIAWHSGNAPANIEKLRSFGFPIYVSQPNKIEDVAREIERMGRLAGTTEVASVTAQEFRKRLAALQKLYGQKAVVRTFYQIWKQPLCRPSVANRSSPALSGCAAERMFLVISIPWRRW